MAITLRDIDRSNWQQCISLQVAADQEHLVAPNVYSLAQAKVEAECIPLAIYAHETMVGFVMYKLDADDGQYWIFRMMIDVVHQRKGYGRGAIQALLARLRELPGCDAVMIDFQQGNVAAARLYESMGFHKTGEVVDGEVIARLDLDR